MENKRVQRGRKAPPKQEPLIGKAQKIARELSKKELIECRSAFEMFDKNNDGSISLEELSTVMQVLGNNPTPGDINKLMADMDTNNNGRIEFDEFLVLMSSHLKEPAEEEQELREAFLMFDRDGNNYIDAHEIRHVMKHLGEKMTEEQIGELLSWADIDGDGRLDYEEFVKVMTRR